MPQKINIAEKGKTWRIESETPALIGKSLGDTIKGAELKPELANYEFKITGGSDKSGMPMLESVEGIGLKRVLLKKGWGMHKHPKKEGKKKVATTKGLRLRKSVRGKTLSESTAQINLNTVKVGDKKLAEIFPDQNKAKETPATSDGSNKPSSSPTETPVQSESQPTPTTEAPKEEVKKEEKPMTEEKEEKIAEEISEEVKEEIKDDIPSSPETKTEEKKEEAAEKVAEEVKEDVEEAAEEIAEDEEKKE